MKKLSVILLVLVAALCLFVSCNKKAEAPVETPSSTTPVAKEEVKAKEPSGKLVVYTTAAQAEQDTIIWDGFCKKYPKIDVEVVQAGSGVLVTRIAAEKENPQADIMAGLNYPQALGSDGELWASYVVPTNSKLPANMQDNTDGKLHYSCTQYVCLIVNKDECAKLGVEVKGYKDLLNPKLKGHIISADPASSSSAWNQLTTMLCVMGDSYNDEKAWNYVEQFAANLGGVMAGSSSACYKQVITGEYAVGVTYEAGVLDYLASGEYPYCELVFPEEGITEILFASAIVKGCKNEENAKLYIDWIMSDECQQALGATSQRQANPNIVPTFPGMVKGTEVKICDRPEGKIGEDKPAIIDRWTKIWAKYSK